MDVSGEQLSNKVTYPNGLIIYPELLVSETCVLFLVFWHFVVWLEIGVATYFDTAVLSQAGLEPGTTAQVSDFYYP